MVSALLESITQTLNYGDLPETWRVPEIERFSTHKTLYGYQEDALKNAARALYLYYGRKEDQQFLDNQKQRFFNRYAGPEIGDLSIKKGIIYINP